MTAIKMITDNAHRYSGFNKFALICCKKMIRICTGTSLNKL